ncbi:MAG TPA: Lrp/AsnC ligand binding domain-containing protein [Nitrosopumilaceae archaeon]|nr:Lrp/AsnC ligand binding domain-containing protein [Nitrosopumilaceae archaeon]
MAVAYVLINCELGADEEITEALKELEEVVFVEKVHGAYDLLVKVEAKNPVELRETISWKVKGVKKIRSTITLMREE